METRTVSNVTIKESMNTKEGWLKENKGENTKYSENNKIVIVCPFLSIIT